MADPKWMGEVCVAFTLGTNETKDISNDFVNEMPRDSDGNINGTIDNAAVIVDPPNTLTVTNQSINGSLVQAQITGSEKEQVYIVWFRAIMSNGNRIDSVPMAIGGQLKTPEGTTP